MQLVIEELTEAQAQELEDLAARLCSEELSHTLLAGIADARRRWVHAAPNLPKRYTLNAEPGHYAVRGKE